MFAAAIAHTARISLAGEHSGATRAHPCPGDQSLEWLPMAPKQRQVRIEQRGGLEAIQALGGAGYTKEWPVERFLRDAKLYDIGAGTNEIRRFLIGRELIGT